MPVVLEPVSDQHRLAVGGFYEILQRIQLPLMDVSGVAVLIIDGPVRHLQKLPGQAGSISSINIRILQRND